MKYFVNGILLLIWFLITVGLVITLVGILFMAVIIDENENPYWFEFGKKLLNNISS